MQYDDKDLYQLSRTLSQFKRLDEFQINAANGYLFLEVSPSQKYFF